MRESALHKGDMCNTHIQEVQGTLHIYTLHKGNATVASQRPELSSWIDHPFLITVISNAEELKWWIFIEHTPEKHTKMPLDRHHYCMNSLRWPHKKKIASKPLCSQIATVRSRHTESFVPSRPPWTLMLKNTNDGVPKRLCSTRNPV